PIQMLVFILWPPPSTAIGWVTLFQMKSLVGLFHMELPLIGGWGPLAIVFLALWAALRRSSPSLMAIALTLELISVATYFASTTAFEMLSLSNQYAAATTAEEQSIFIAAGQAMLATWQGTAFNVSYL